MVYVISNVIENQILNEMRESHHFALMFDETKDCTVTGQLPVHGRYIHATGELKSHYLRVLNLLYECDSESQQDFHFTVSAGAKTFTSHVCAFIEQTGLDMTKF